MNMVPLKAEQKSQTMTELLCGGQPNYTNTILFLYTVFPHT